MGGSNGGLLVGAVEEQRPDLFAVALPAVGVMDMLRYDKFTGGRAWATEYGSSSDAAQFAYLIKYSPVQNVKAGVCYPATLVTTADHDDRVVPSHSFKFTAAMQAAQACDRPILIRVETQASHGYRPTDKRIAELADEWAFAAAQMEVRPTLVERTGSKDLRYVLSRESESAPRSETERAPIDRTSDELCGQSFVEVAEYRCSWPTICAGSAPGFGRNFCTRPLKTSARYRLPSWSVVS